MWVPKRFSKSMRFIKQIWTIENICVKTCCWNFWLTFVSTLVIFEIRFIQNIKTSKYLHITTCLLLVEITCLLTFVNTYPTNLKNIRQKHIKTSSIHLSVWDLRLQIFDVKCCLIKSFTSVNQSNEGLFTCQQGHLNSRVLCTHCFP